MATNPLSIKTLCDKKSGGALNRATALIMTG
jgi:hypothetical protein